MSSAGSSVLARLTATLLEHDAWTPHRLHGHRRERLQALVRHAVAVSPFYRERLGPDAGRREVALEQLPTVTKAALMDSFDRIFSDLRLRRADLDAHLAGDGSGRPVADDRRAFSSSGTTGLRGLFVYSEGELALWTAANLRMLSRIGITPAMRLVAIGAPSPHHATRQLFSAFQAGRDNAPRLSVLTPLREIVDALNAYQPAALVSYPSMAGLLAEEQAEGRLRIRPRFVVLGAEVLADDMRARVHAAWDVQPANVYAANEALGIASSTPQHPALEVSDDLLIVEVVDERNLPVAPGTPGTKILLTNLVNYTQPLIRYELTDAVTLAPEPNPAGRPYQTIARVEGRSSDILRLPARAGGRVAVHPYLLHAPFARFPDVRQYQLAHDERGLHARIRMSPGAETDTPARIRAALLDALESSGAVPPPVDVTPVAAMEREPGPGAKLSLIKTT